MLPSSADQDTSTAPTGTRTGGGTSTRTSASGGPFLAIPPHIGTGTGTGSGGASANAPLGSGPASPRDLFDAVVSLICDSGRGDGHGADDDNDTSTSTRRDDAKLPDAVRLRLYGLYKRCTVGRLRADGRGGDEDDSASSEPESGPGAEDASASASGRRPAGRPSIFHVVACAKYDAWADCDRLTVEEARLAYVQLAAEQDHAVGRRCLGLLRRFEEAKHETEIRAGAGGGAGATDAHETFQDALEVLPTQLPPSPSQTQPRPPLAAQKRDISPGHPSCSPKRREEPSPSLLERWTGIKPLTPRGRLDITLADLAFAIWTCLRMMLCNVILPVSKYSSRADVRRRQERAIGRAWRRIGRSGVEGGDCGDDCDGASDDGRNGERDAAAADDVVTGLSVRSLLDAYLTARNFPSGSEVILAPCITIPGMLRVLQHHGIRVVPIDILPSSDGDADGIGLIGVDIGAVRRAIGPRTVAILVTHPFGMICTSDEDMASIRSMATHHGLDLVEDCAECYAGGGGQNDSYGGSSEAADVCLYSFGTIKTATVLGGGIAIVREQSLGDAMRRAQLFNGQQTNAEYLDKLFKYSILHLISFCPSLCGIIACAMRVCGFDYHRIVTSMLRGFRRRDLIGQIRKRPSTALLSLMHRRLAYSAVSTASVVSARVRRCQSLSRRLVESCSHSLSIPKGVEGSRHCYWLFPIHVDDPKMTSELLLREGLDAPSGASQLTSATMLGDIDGDCPIAERLMRGIIYLPVASQYLRKPVIQRIVRVLSREEEAREKYSGPSTSMTRRIRPLLAVTAALSPVVIAIAAMHIGSYRLFLWFWEASLWIALGCGIITMSLHHFISRDYMRLSTAMRKYSIDNLESTMNRDSCNNTKGCALNTTPFLQVPCNKMTGSSNYVLLTGATGFIGSLLLRELLVHREQLGIAGVVAFCRSKGPRSAHDRMAKVLSGDMFSFLTDDEKKNLVLVIDGDVTRPDVGMTRQDMLRVQNVLCISHVFHCAASVSFTQSLEDAATSNITSSLQLQQLTKQLKMKDAKFVYISTAFVHGGSTGTEASPLPERLHLLHPYDPRALYRSMLETQAYASAAMHDLGFPNTYTFSKCICEHLLLQGGDSNTIIIRPSIVGPAVQEPWEGWAGSKPSTLVAAACLYLKFPYNLWSFGTTSVPFVPVDVVCRFVLAKAFGSTHTGGREIEESRPPSSSSGSFADSSPSISSDDSTDEGSYQKNSLPIYDEMVSTTTPSSSGISISSNTSQNGRGKRIFTASWDSQSQSSSSFLWIEYAITITHVGVVFGYMSRLVVYIGMVFTVKLFPWLNLNLDTYRKVHTAIIVSPLDFLCGFLGKVGIGQSISRDLRLIFPFLDLPLLFFPFTNKSFYFRSEIDALPDFDGQRYMLNCALAAEKFVQRIGSKTKTDACSGADDLAVQEEGMSNRPCSQLVIAGASHRPILLDSLWALSQPRGNIVIRTVGWLLIKIFRMTLEELTVDISKIVRLAEAKKKVGRPCHIILAPTHRSLYDFLIVTFIAFALPELGVDLPYIAAAEDFHRVPILGWLIQCTGAFFLHRGRGAVDPEVCKTVERIKKETVFGRSGDDLSSIEVFIEGTRSRDRRFVKPKTGFIRCLQETSGDLVILPITINYEAIPDQASLSADGESGSGSNLRVQSLLKWLWHVACGRISLGRVHVATAEPILSSNVVDDKGIKSQSPSNIVRVIQSHQMCQIFISSYHVEAASRVLGLEHETVRCAVKELGGKFWKPYDAGTQFSFNRHQCRQSIPSNRNELLTVMLHFGHLLAPLVQETHPSWCEWLGCTLTNKLAAIQHTTSLEEVEAVKSALQRLFSASDDIVDAVLKKMKDHGFDFPSGQHVLKYAKERAKQESSPLPSLLLKVAVSFQRASIQDAAADFNFCDDGSVTPLFTSDTSCQHVSSSISACSSESFGAWGHRDSGFVIKVEKDGSRAVVMKGNRYNISNVALPRLIPFLEKESQLRVNTRRLSLPPAADNPTIANSALQDEDVCKLLEIVSGDRDRVSLEAKVRARHGTGHTQADMYLIRSNSLERLRLPDAVIFPENGEEIKTLVTLSTEEQWCLVPFGGGTNVSHATHCPPLELEPRPIITVDMRQMKQVLWIDEANGLAHVQAGITGAELVDQMKERGYTIGHEPDSIEFSTLGGWIATKASGMKRNKYGNIEDIVQDVHVIGSNFGCSQRACQDYEKADKAVSTYGRVSTGMDLSTLMFGSEGNCGIITSAIIKIWPLPETTAYNGIIFASFEDGLKFVREVAKLSSSKPASVRLLDNEQFRLGQALRKECAGIAWIVEYLMKMVSIWTNSFSPSKAVCATIAYEGSSDEVKYQQQCIGRIASTFGGISTGPRTGRAGYDLTFAIAYLRDFAMSYHFLAESFETFVPWSKVEEVMVRTKERIVQEHRKRFLPGNPIISSRVTQLYDNGACVYFYFCMNYEGIAEPSRVYGEIEAAARDEILLCGGSLSHHHGVGKLRAPFMPRISSESHRRSLLDVKKSLDPLDVFGVRNGLIG